MSPEQSVPWAERDLVALHEEERDSSVREEGRIALAEILCVLLVALFVVLRQLFLV